MHSAARYVSTGRLHLGPLPVFRLADDLEVLLRLVPDLVAVHARALLSVGVTGTEGARLPGSGGVRAWKQRGVVRFHAEQDVEQRVGVDNVPAIGSMPTRTSQSPSSFSGSQTPFGVSGLAGPPLAGGTPLSNHGPPRDVVGQVVALNGPDGVRQFDPGGTGYSLPRKRGSEREGSAHFLRLLLNHVTNSFMRLLRCRRSGNGNRALDEDAPCL